VQVVVQEEEEHDEIDVVVVVLVDEILLPSLEGEVQEEVVCSSSFEMMVVDNLVGTCV